MGLDIDNLPKFEVDEARKAYGKALVELGEKNQNIVVMNCDLSGSCKTADFCAKFPERFFNMGIAEQNMMGVAAGLATTGKTVFASTFAMFATGRVFDQIRQSIAYPRMNVKIVATHAGITVGGDGASHQTNEDIALMRVIPNMSIIVPMDYNETYEVIHTIADLSGPFYVRMGRSKIPNISKHLPGYSFEFGKSTMLVDGSDVTIIAMGLMVGKALEAAVALKKEGISARVVNMSTVKPIDEEAIVKHARETGAIVTAEEHNLLFGLGSAVAEVLTHRVKVPEENVGIPDVFGESGQPDELMEKYGLTVNEIVKCCHRAIERKDEDIPRKCK